MTAPLICEECMRAGSAALLAATDFTGLGASRRTPPRLTVRGLIEHAARLFAVTAEEITGQRRWKRLIVPRRAIALVARWASTVWVDGRAVAQRSYPEIGAVLGGRDHSSVIHAFREGEKALAEDPEFAWLVERLWAAAECDVFCEKAPLGEPVDDDDPEAEAAAWLPPPAEPGGYRARHALPLTPDMIDPDNAGFRSVRAGSSMAAFG